MGEVARHGHKELLLEGAIECLQERGYAHATARDIVAASGTNLASIGYHYGSKERLLNAAVVEAVRRWLGPLVAMAAEQTDADPLGRLRLTFAAAFDSMEENRALVAGCLEAWAQLPRSEDLRREMSDLYEDFRLAISQITRRAFAAGTPDGGSQVDSDALATLVIAAFDGLLIRWQLDPESMKDASRLVAALDGAIASLASGTRA